MRTMGYMPTEMELIELSQQINMNCNYIVAFCLCDLVNVYFFPSYIYDLSYNRQSGVDISILRMYHG